MAGSSLGLRLALAGSGHARYVRPRQSGAARGNRRAAAPCRCSTVPTAGLLPCLLSLRLQQCKGAQVDSSRLQQVPHTSHRRLPLLLPLPPHEQAT